MSLNIIRYTIKKIIFLNNYNADICHRFVLNQVFFFKFNKKIRNFRVII